MLIYRYRFRLRAQGCVRFPAFPGPALRGALGEQPEVYQALLRPPPALPQKRFSDPPRPLVLRPRFDAGTYSAGSVLELDATLVGSAGACFPALLRGMARVGEQGVGAGRNPSSGEGCFRIEQVDALAPGGFAPVVTPEGWLRLASLPWRLPDEFAAPTVAAGARTLHFYTPTFIRRGGDPRGSLEFADIVEDLVQRVSLLSQAYGAGPVYGRHEELALTDVAADVRMEDAAVRWVEVPRYSRNQARPMTFGGWMGWVRYADVPCSVLPLLHAAEGLHIGKHTAFGFGAITLSDTGGAWTGT